MTTFMVLPDALNAEKLGIEPRRRCNTSYAASNGAPRTNRTFSLGYRRLHAQSPASWRAVYAKFTLNELTYGLLHGLLAVTHTAGRPY